MNLKFGVIYAQNGQFTDDEFFSNTQGSPEFEDFLNLLGDHIILKGKIRQKVYISDISLYYQVPENLNIRDFEFFNDRIIYL